MTSTGSLYVQHAVRLWWEEFSSVEQTIFANVSVNLMSKIANLFEEWVLKSQTTALVAEMVRREGLDLWKELFPSLVSISNNGLIQVHLQLLVLMLTLQSSSFYCGETKIAD